MNDIDSLPPLERMIRKQIMDRGIVDARTLEAMRSVKRENFVPPDRREQAYIDEPVPIGHGQTISQPYIVALMTQRLDVQPENRVLEIGTGCGYQTAILARLAKEIYTIEIVKPLLDDAWERIMSLGIRNVHFRHGDGTRGWPQAAPFDRILIGAAARTMPRRLLTEQLADNGSAVLPVGEERNQTLYHVRKNGSELVITDICPVRFVDLIGPTE
jgi:protein-L-isoaspartate(D-aspartate) O-methyltransferase